METQDTDTQEISEQTENLDRCLGSIGKHVEDFVAARLNQEFFANDLRNYVFAKVDGFVSPASPDRILRDLRQARKLNYELVSRSKSLYRAIPVAPL